MSISMILWIISIGVVIVGTCVGMLLMWVTQFDRKIKQQAKEREEDIG